MVKVETLGLLELLLVQWRLHVLAKLWSKAMLEIHWIVGPHLSLQHRLGVKVTLLELDVSGGLEGG